MFRRLFIILSAVLCVLTCVLWVRSYRGFDAMLYVARHWHVSATTLRGTTVFQRATEFHLDAANIRTGLRSGPLPTNSEEAPGEESKFPIWLYMAGYNDRTSGWLAWTGIGFGDGPHTPDYPPDFRQSVVVIPFGYWLAIFATSPCFVIVRLFFRRFRKLRGACEFCGYDLRTTPARCPECGTEPSKVRN